MESALFYSSIAGNQKVDAETGVISGVSVITEGECLGRHAGTFVDQTTLSSLLKLATAFKDGVKVKLSMNKEHDGSVGQIIGSLKAFRIDGNQLRADLHLLKSDDNFGKIVEMSSKMPESFGLSIVVPKHYETVNGKPTLRPTDIFSVDLVEEPAANKNGLFSAKPNNTMSDTIKFAADGKTHEKDCECKACMSAKSKSEMSAMIAEQIALAIKGIQPAPTPELATLTAKLTEHETALAAFKASAETAALSAKKSEIAGLVADATREGKVIPLTEDELAKMDVSTVKAMFSKLVPNQVKLTGKRGVETPKDKDGKPVTFDTADKRIAFCQDKLAEGAAQLTAQFLADSTLGLTRN
jgi:hypothetical protein